MNLAQARNVAASMFASDDAISSVTVADVCGLPFVTVHRDGTVTETNAEGRPVADVMREAIAAATREAPAFIATIRGVYERLATEEEIAAFWAWQRANAKIFGEGPGCLIANERHVLVDGFSITRDFGPKVAMSAEAEAIHWAF